MSWTTYAPIIIVLLILIIGSVNTRANRINLYQSNYTPPSYVFGIVWSILYTLITISWCLFNVNTTASNYNLVNWLFVINLTLNLSWSLFFFGDNQLTLGLIIITLMIISLVWLLYELRNDLVSFWCLVPYLIWLCVAFYLNFYIVNHNLIIDNTIISAK